MARCFNIQGEIKMSLQYLMSALQHVEDLAKDQPAGSVTIFPELSLNICNALIYLKDFYRALDFADKAVVSSKQCIKSLKHKLEHPNFKDPSKKHDQERLS